MNATLVILERNEKIVSLLYRDNRLFRVNACDTTSHDLDSIYIGKVKNVVPTIEAAFVEYREGALGFLPMKHLKNPMLLNRQYDGRLIAGDELVVQIEKEASKTKASGLTCNLSFAGKYLCLTTGNTRLGFSSKLKEAEKKTLRSYLEMSGIQKQINEEQIGLIVRTNAGELLTKGESEDSETALNQKTMISSSAFWIKEKSILKTEFETLLQQLQEVRQNASYRTCFFCLYQPEAAYLKELRDSYAGSFERIVTDVPQIYEEVRNYFQGNAFRLKQEKDNSCRVFRESEKSAEEQIKIELYQDSKLSLAKLYSVETRLREAMEERVWLNSGAYLIIQQTEALTVIDVNSGKIQKKHPGDNIYFTINKEAAVEIALQLTLRNISGIIIVDFINQNTKKQDDELLSYLSSLVKKDSVQTNVIDMTPLGLVELTRKKINKPLREML